MTIQRTHAAGFALALAIALGWAASSAAVVAESKRLGRAKDYMAEEQWTRAIDELRTAANDAKEPRRDEALYWLAHSLNQFGDPGSALETIRQLERSFPSSIWVKPAGSLRIEIAVKLNRSDVLWWTVVSRATPVAVTTRTVPTPRVPPPAAGADPPPTATTTVTPKPLRPKTPGVPPVPPPPAVWLSEVHHFDGDLQILALGSLMRTDAVRVIPRLKAIAFDTADPGQASRALFILAQSKEPAALATVELVARTGPEMARLAAVRELGRFGGPEVSKALFEVYVTAKEPLKRQVVKSLGERSEKLTLHRIVESEENPELRNRAIVTLGQAGDSTYLAVMYPRATVPTKQMIIVGLFAARAEAELINIAERERDQKLRIEVRVRLHLLGTPKALEYLLKTSENR